MSRESAAAKRKREDSNKLLEAERTLLPVIKKQGSMGIWSWTIKRETKLPEQMVTKALNSLKAKNLIKEVIDVHSKGRKTYMAIEFEPSKELTGGAWYVEGTLDTDFIKVLKDQCLRHIAKLKIATIEAIADSIRSTGILTIECSVHQIGEIIKALVLDNEILELKSTGVGDFGSIPAGAECYKCVSKGGGGGGAVVKIGSMGSIPCGVCPRISECTPGGIVSPTTCEYYAKWLQF